MARLHIQPENSGTTAKDLNWGVTRLGRAPDNDIVIDHPSVSQHHAELELGTTGMFARDLGSTNGTYLAGRMISQAAVPPGATLRFGEVQVTVEWSQETVSVPVIEVDKQPASVDLGDGVMSCIKHPTVASTWLCGACMKYFCATCPRNVRLVGRPSRWTCPECGNAVAFTPWADPNGRKVSLWKRLKNTFSRATGR
jgi:DNA-directed RNA polymerase subunit RPC12/RpoP